MTDRNGWFAGVDPDDRAAAIDAVRHGSADEPDDWPARAVEAEFAADADAYYDRLHEVTLAAAREVVAERERADDRQLVHAVRAMDDARRTANELAERVAEWAGSRYEDAGTGVEYARELAAEGGTSGSAATDWSTGADGPTATDGPMAETGGSGVSDEDDASTDPSDVRLRALAARTADLADEADELERSVRALAPEVAPNLSAMAGPVLAARLVSLAGGLEELAKSPSSTVQVLGAEDALFAHLRGSAPSPKHGVIYSHEYVRGTRAPKRGSAARALAGKLTIAARIDHYSGDRRPELDAELDERIRQVRSGGGS